jgi:hypothetical protein
MQYLEQLDLRLESEARALIYASLGRHEDFEYVKLAEDLCAFEGGRPQAKELHPVDRRHLEFLRELRIVKADGKCFRLNIKVNTEVERPVLAWDFNAR